MKKLVRFCGFSVVCLMLTNSLPARSEPVPAIRRDIPEKTDTGGRPDLYNCSDRGGYKMIDVLPDPIQEPALNNSPGDLPLDHIAPEFDCEINLSDNLFGNRKTDAIQFSATPANGQAVVKLTLNPKTTEYSKAIFEIELCEKVEGHIVNIGDSSTNNGYAGDSATQSRDSELHIVGEVVTVYGDDHIKDQNEKVLGKTAEFAVPGSVLTIAVSDNLVSWRNSKGLEGKADSPYVFSLNGQADTEGPVNHDIYAAFNRVINDSSRRGTGVKRVRIKLVH